MRCLSTLVCLLLALGCADDKQGDPHASGGAAGQGGGPPLLAEYVLSSGDSIPEGVTFDPIGRAFYVSSLNGGGLTRVQADGSEQQFVAGSGARVAGIKVDAKNRRLWACANTALWVFDLASADRLREFPLDAAAQGGTCNDVTVDGNGRAYATDSNKPNIYSAHVDDAAASVFATDPRFLDTALGLNGIELNDDGTALFTAMYLAGKLFRLPLATPDTVVEVALTGTFSAPDGLVALDGAVYAVTDSQVQKVTFDDPSQTAGRVTASAYPDGGLSTGTAAERQLYVVKSETTAFVLGQQVDLPFKVSRIPLDSFR